MAFWSHFIVRERIGQRSIKNVAIAAQLLRTSCRLSQFLISDKLGIDGVVVAELRGPGVVTVNIVEFE